MINKVNEVKSFGGRQLRFEHQSKVLNCVMQFSVFYHRKQNTKPYLHSIGYLGSLVPMRTLAVKPVPNALRLNLA